MRRILPALLLPALLAGCAAPGPTLEQRLSTFINRSEAELVARLGVPVRTYETGGRRFLQFEERQTVLVPGDPWGYGYYGYRRPWHTPSSYAVVQCDMTFAIRNDRVESFTARGQGCD
ncbi:hypothetical protein CR162_19000 [Pseudoroseomonas rhizosphaerae]|uniref:Lipoprotein SmpA/OmlA domain-containing protein n=1 Tax=Teichococcus rhizosphaerae TaxID=1335062 RepID=A0A2C6Z4B8_9PROT|nr:hypothetical protein [Pseudoroseomonas rhizosphaerae]PHK93351.1 hypothetical protein CR162_19000 [Pseudoroseomonas rhizosphaerae]